MKNFLFVFIPMLVGCATQFNVLPTGSRIVNDADHVRHFVNDGLGFSAELSPLNWEVFEYDSTGKVLPDDWDVIEYNTEIVANKREKRILKLIGFDYKKDTMLYLGRGSMLILKNNKVDLQQFRIINLYDSVLSVTPLAHWKVNFYRKTIVNKKYKLFIINDLIPFGDKYFQRIEYTESYFPSYTYPDKYTKMYIIDPVNPDDVLCYAEIYKSIIRLTKETYNNILQKKIVETKHIP